MEAIHFASAHHSWRTKALSQILICLSICFLFLTLTIPPFTPPIKALEGETGVDSGHPKGRVPKPAAPGSPGKLLDVQSVASTSELLNQKSCKSHRIILF